MNFQSIFIVMIVVGIIIPAVIYYIFKPRDHDTQGASALPVEPATPFLDPEQPRADALRILSATRRAHRSDVISEATVRERAAEVTRHYLAQATNTALDELSDTALQQRLGEQPALSSAASYVTEIYRTTSTPNADRSAEKSLSIAEQVVLAWR
ncbi:MAG: hypothetical protein ACRCWS_03970 [Propionibacteriaceae bacterium]